MSVLSFVQYHYLKRFSGLVNQNRFHAIECQQKVFLKLINTVKNTAFGNEHDCNSIKTYNDFKKNIPLRNYSDYSSYIERIFKRESSVLYPGLPAFFGKSSGTSDKPKLLPITKDFLQNTQYAALYMLCNLSMQLGNAKFMGGKVLALTDQQSFENINGFLCGAVSSIKTYNMPHWAKRFSFPSNEINDIENPAEKIEATIRNITGNNIQMAVALPVYLSYFLSQFEIIQQQKFKSVFSDFKAIFLSGMNYEPYESLLRNHLGNDVLIMENYSATEGSFAYQADPHKKGMELICNQGIFYEFVALENINKKAPGRLSLNDVQTGKQYSIVISANNGLYGYVMNDIVEFISIQPYRLKVCGRLKDIFSPFGEQLLPIQAEQAMGKTCNLLHQTLIDFIILPDFNFEHYRYICYVELESEIKDNLIFANTLHQQLCNNNSYYEDLVKTGAITTPELILVRKNFFHELLTITSKFSAQQKNTHLITDKARIAKMESLV